MVKRVGKYNCLLTDLLKNAGMTQKELADKIGVPKQQINKYVKNQRRMSYNTAQKVAEALNCSMDQLYE